MRNWWQVMGRNHEFEQVKPIQFALCYTNDGCEHHDNRTKATGGTGQFISYASFFNIPIINMKNENWKNKFNHIVAFGVEQQ